MLGVLRHDLDDRALGDRPHAWRWDVLQATTWRQTGSGTSTILTSGHKTTKGFAVAHVFDNPGTYVVAAFVHDLAGAAGFGTKTITVTAISGTTYYVSTSGSDGANG